MDKTNLETILLHQMNPLGRFSDRALDYAQYRPTYPTEAIDQILTGLGEASQLIVGDIGAGTGISSRLLADRGIRVIAIEPNLEMRQAAETHPLVDFREGTAENTNLADDSVDLVSCFQSFHWFDPEPTMLEFRRILKPQGRVALVWNLDNRDHEFTQRYEELIEKICEDYPSRKSFASEKVLEENSLFPNFTENSFTHRQEFNLKGLIGLMMSHSFVPRSGMVHQQLISGLGELFDRFVDENGKVYLAYRTNLYLASCPDL